MFELRCPFSNERRGWGKIDEGVGQDRVWNGSWIPVAMQP